MHGPAMYGSTRYGPTGGHGLGRPVARRSVLRASFGGVLGGATALAGGSRPLLAEPRYDRVRQRAPFSDPDFFPIGVWLQNPGTARAWKAAGINLYIALWKGPTRAQLDALDAAGMTAIVAQNEIALEPRYDRLIAGWFVEPDEPDNAQPIHGTNDYGAPVPPEAVIRRYEAIRQRDPTRPALLNLGQGVAWDGWFGRGPRTGHPEDYADYLRACDIASFDIYPVTSRFDPVRGRIERIGHGVTRLRQWSAHGQGIWAVIGASRIDNPDRAPAPAEIRAQAWMAIVHGAQGIVWFVHQFRPRFVEAAVLEDAQARAALTAVNAEIAALAPVLNLGVPEPDLQLDAGAGVTLRALRHDGALWLFGINDRPSQTRLRIGVPDDRPGIDLASGAAVETRGGRFTARLEGYAPLLLRFG